MVVCFIPVFLCLRQSFVLPLFGVLFALADIVIAQCKHLKQNVSIFTVMNFSLATNASHIEHWKLIKYKRVFSVLLWHPVCLLIHSSQPDQPPFGQCVPLWILTFCHRLVYMNTRTHTHIYIYKTCVCVRVRVCVHVLSQWVVLRLGTVNCKWHTFIRFRKEDCQWRIRQTCSVLEI